MRRLLIAAITLTVFSACSNSDRYEMSKDALGRTIRLDKKTGEVAVIEGDRITILKTPKDVAEEKRKEESLAAPKEWPTVKLPQLDNIEAKLRTSWRDGRLYYQFTISPISKQVMAARNRPYGLPSFTAEFYDVNGFKLGSINLFVKALSEVVDDKGNLVELNANDSIAMDKTTYANLSSWNLAWSF